MNRGAQDGRSIEYIKAGSAERLQMEESIECITVWSAVGLQMGEV